MESKSKGYFVSNSIIENLINYQEKAAANYSHKNANNYSRHSLDQAYRLYTLAKAGQPDIGAMNRLRNKDKLSVTSSHLLAASYALIGKTDIADILITGKSHKVEAYIETGNTYGSHVRDMSIILETLSIIGKNERAAEVVELISKELNSNNWHSTQSTCLLYTSPSPRDLSTSRMPSSA